MPPFDQGRSGFDERRESRSGTAATAARFLPATGTSARGDNQMKGIVLWLLGVPIGVIILLYIFVFN